MIFSYVLTQATLALLSRNFSSTDERMHYVDRYSYAMLVERDQHQSFTEDVTELDELAVTYMEAMMRREMLMHASAMANEAYVLASRGMLLAVGYQRDWARKQLPAVKALSDPA